MRRSVTLLPLCALLAVTFASVARADKPGPIRKPGASHVHRGYYYQGRHDPNYNVHFGHRRGYSDYGYRHGHGGLYLGRGGASWGYLGGSYFPGGYSGYSYPGGSLYPNRLYYIPEYGYTTYLQPSIYAPAEAAYGPQAVKRFMGVANDFARIPQPAALPAEDPPLVLLRKKYISNPQTRARARRYLTTGDGRFAQQQTHSANERYRQAIQTAPDLADPYFRHGHAMVALGRYAEAVTAFRAGISADPTWAQSGYRLADLYGPQQIAKTAHLDALAAAALDKPNDAGLMYLLGIFLHYDGQAERAQKFFRRAERLAGINDAHIRPFLDGGEPFGADNNVAAAGVEL